MGSLPLVDREGLPSLQSLLPLVLWSESFTSRREASLVAPRWSLLSHHRAARRKISRRQRSPHACTLPLAAAPENVSRDEKRVRSEAIAEPLSPTLSTAPALWSTPLRSPAAAAAASGVWCKPIDEEMGNADEEKKNALVEDALSIEFNREVAWTVLAAVVRQVRALHLAHCPLCAPPRPPHWWTVSPVDHRAQKIIKPLKEEREDSSQTEVEHGHVMAEAQVFLSHVYERRAGLEATRPAMYAVAEHALLRACAKLGGVALLEALLIGAEGK